MSQKDVIPQAAVEALFKKSTEHPTWYESVKGYDFNDGIDYHALLSTYKTSGFQATNFGLAVEEINKMIECRIQPLSDAEKDRLEKGEDEFIQRRYKCTIILDCTSSMLASGVRDTIRFLVQHNLVDCIVTTAEGVEEDIIKCLAPTLVGDFPLEERVLRDKSAKMIGNLLVTLDNYCVFENWIFSVLDELLCEQRIKRNITWTPSKVIARFGEKIDDPQSICYWAAKNKIPIFTSSLHDGCLGDTMYIHSYRNNEGLDEDISPDICRFNSIVAKALNTGMIILGGGVAEHHLFDNNLKKNGADFVVHISTANESDGSDSETKPDEAVSWCKIKKTASPVKIHADATLIFPLLVAETFARVIHESRFAMLFSSFKPSTSSASQIRLNDDVNPRKRKRESNKLNEERALLGQEKVVSLLETLVKLQETNNSEIIELRKEIRELRSCFK